MVEFYFFNVRTFSKFSRFPLRVKIKILIYGMSRIELTINSDLRGYHYYRLPTSQRVHMFL